MTFWLIVIIFPNSMCTVCEIYVFWLQMKRFVYVGVSYFVVFILSGEVKLPIGIGAQTTHNNTILRVQSKRHAYVTNRLICNRKIMFHWR